MKGAVLVVDKELLEKGVPAGIKTCGHFGNCIDWISSDLSLADEIARKSQLLTAEAYELAATLRAYCESEPIPPSTWIESTYIGIGCNGL